MATVSLCMIVRDEEAMLPGCLASVAGVVDELVVVDTGSRDRTREVARAAGASVLEQLWEDDFSAPRNRGLEACRSDWVLVLDADERLTPGAATTLRHALAEDDFDCGLLPLHNAARLDATLEDVVRGSERIADVVYLPRLFRRTPDLRYTGIVHENVGPWLFAQGRRARPLPGVDVVHLGVVPDVRSRRDKRERNVRLLERACERDPDDLAPYGYLAHELLEAGQRERAREVAERGFAVLRRGGAQLELSTLRLVTARAWLLVQAGDAAAARETLEVAAQRLAPHPDVFFLRGCVAESDALHATTSDERSAALGASLSEFRAALACADRFFLQKFIDGVTGWAAEVRCGTALLLLGQIGEARAAFERALLEAPRAREARLGLVESRLVTDDPRSALRELQGVLDDRPDGWTLAALAAEALGSLDAMQGWLGKAQAVVGAGFVAPHRRERYHDAIAALGTYLARPTSAPGPLGRLAWLVGGSVGEAPPLGPRRLDAPTVAPIARRLIAHLLRAGRFDAVERLVDEVAEAALPGIAALVGSVVDELEAARPGGETR